MASKQMSLFYVPAFSHLGDHYCFLSIKQLNILHIDDLLISIFFKGAQKSFLDSPVLGDNSFSGL